MSLPEAIRRRSWRHVVIGLLVWAALVVPGIVLWPQDLGGNVDYLIVSGTSMEPRMHTGDIVLTRRSPRYDVGDVVAYRVPAGDAGAGHVVIHRITGTGDRGFVTQGDNRDQPDLWQPAHTHVLGEEWLRVPRAALLLDRLRSPVALAIVAGAGTALALLLPSRRREDEPVADLPAAERPLVDQAA